MNVFVKTSVTILIILLLACQSNPKLHETTLSIKEIKEIGELVTAEYYGEVLSSLSIMANIKYNELFTKYVDTVKQSYLIFNNLFDTENENKLKKLHKKIVDESSDRRPNTGKIARLQSRIHAIEASMQREKIRKYKIARSRQEQNALKMVSNACGLNQKEILTRMSADTSLTWNDLKESNKKEYAKFIKKQKKKKELVYLARGTVKAGYDLKKLDSLNVFMSPNGDTIYLLDFDPIITDLDINPWFYFPEVDSVRNNKEEQQALFGFQIIYSQKEGDMTLAEVTELKSECKRLLREEALDRNIYNHAHTNAEDALTGLFGLFTTKQNTKVQKVVISHSKYFYDKINQLYDQHIDSSEFAFIRQTMLRDLDTLDDVAFYKQSLQYQRKYLDVYIKDLYAETRLKANYMYWDTLANWYFNKRNILVPKQ